MAEDNQKRYKVVCPHCGRIQYACKSILHTWGLNDYGYGTCLKCGNPMRLIYSPETDKMQAATWET